MKQSTRITRYCLHCLSPFLPEPAQIRRGAGIYCSRNCYHQHCKKSPEERFWAFVQKTDACWIWQGHRMKNGYGVFGARAGENPLAHRYSWELHHKSPVPEGMNVCHTCDIRHCVNPSHLWIGTQQENQSDMVSKGRSLKGILRPDLAGEHHGGSKLTDEHVRAIRARYVPRVVTLKQLSREYGVGISTIYHVIRGENWRYVKSSDKE